MDRKKWLLLFSLSSITFSNNFGYWQIGLVVFMLLVMEDDPIFACLAPG